MAIFRETAAMGMIHEGGCLCGAIRYRTLADPQRVTVCHCTFCQRITGSAFLVEPVFKKADVEFSGAALSAYDHRSDTTNTIVTVKFCGHCGTTLCLDLERAPDVVPLCAGTFDDPNWFDRAPDRYRHVFTRSAQAGVVLPAGVNIYEAQAVRADGIPNAPTVFADAVMVERRKPAQ
jgi:hypothetical protein